VSSRPPATIRQTSPRFVWGRSDFIVFYPCLGAWAIWALGYADQALEWSREARALAQALPRPAQFANALSLTALLHMFLRDPRMAQERADATIALANEHGFPFELSYGTFERGWALFEQGYLKEGTAEMHRATTTFAATGVGMRSRWFPFLAEARARSEGPEVGLEVLAEGMAVMEGSGERMNEAELHRVKGELLLMHDAENAPDAEHCFRTAIQVTRRQGGKFFELRATTSLARLLASQGRRDEPRTMLAAIYDWFTEGFDTADLKDAKALLDRLDSES
jgi:predicted ATPase